ncbi:MAG: asparagine synthase (glutamine-hydrolyzing) [Chitinophagaceae bacterium]|nr:asparagine synthase (glutamine-hydrolyzing) [Chitinophagaceae bacterium]
MCGITGFINPGWSRYHLEAMTDRLAHRGPDAKGYYEDDTCGLGLGHRRLSILDLSEAGNQPFFSRDGRYSMVFNGEVFNFREVASKYGIVQQTHTDSEVIIEAFAQRGVEAVHDFNGMFAIAIWDTQQKELYLIRDRFGVKPLLYYYDQKYFAFASELKALLSAGIPKEINHQSLQGYLYLEYIPGNESIIRNVYKLPPGHFLKISPGAAPVIRSYYSLLDKLNPFMKNISEEKALDEFEALLSSSVQLRQISDVPIGAFLSGGTDSSLICALFQKQNSQPINTFTIGFDVKEFDESAYANKVATHLHTAHRHFQLTDSDSIAIVDKLVNYYDEPFAAPSCLPSYLVCNKARSLATVALSGDGGDELFMGYGYYGLYKRLKKFYTRYPSFARNGIAGMMRLLNSRYQRASRLLQFQNNDDLFVNIWSQEQYMFTGDEIAVLTGKKFTNDILAGDWEKINSLNLEEEESISLFDINNYLSNNLLFKMDSASMANSLEVRTPYLDYRLVEFSVNLPLHYKIRGGTQKYLMKKLLEKYIPADLVYRTKWGFPAPVGDWLYKDLRYTIDQWLSKESIQRAGVFDEAVVKKWVKEFLAGKKYHYKRIWSMIVFQMWHHQYITGDAH